MSVAIVVPVLDRPAQVARLMASVAAATPEPHRLLFVANTDDVDELAALEAAGADVLVVPAARRSWAKKINDGYRDSTEEWIFTGADDLAFHPGWFSAAVGRAGPDTGVIGTNDLWNPRVMGGEHSTHSLVRRSYADRYGTADQPGLIVHEGYGHDWADDELVATAKQRGAWVHAADSVVEHLRPRNRADEDATYRLGRRQSQAGKALYRRRSHLFAPPPPARATVVTACYGGVDTDLHPQAPQDVPTDWVCFTDQPGLTAPPPWRVVHAPARFDHPCLAAKVHKATPTVGADDVIWIDANMQTMSRSFVREALAARHDGVAVFRHPRRDDIYLEARESLGAESQNGKYAGQPLLEQVAHYRAEGHPEHGGLYACGTVAWDLSNPAAVELGRVWLAECERWSWQDQLSFPVVCRRIGITPGVFPLPQLERRVRHFGNQWLQIHPHVAKAPRPARRRAPMVAPPDVSVLVPYSSGDEHRRRARSWVLDWYARHYPAWELVEGTCDGPWSKGRALADAAGRATHDVFVLADADSVVPAETLADAVRLVAAGAAWVMPHKKVYRLSRAHTERIYGGTAPDRRDLARSPYAGVVGGGITVLSRRTWETAGGIDPRFVGWGGEDIAFGWALETLCGPGVRLDAPLFHLWHEQLPQGQHRRGSPQSEALAGRYRQARNKPEAMRALTAEAALVAGAV